MNDFAKAVEWVHTRGATNEAWRTVLRDGGEIWPPSALGRDP